MTFRSRVNYPEAIPTPSGKSFSRVFVKAYDDNGEPYLRDTGQIRHDYDLIQAYLDDTRIANIVARYESGDKSVLAKTQKLYADLTATAHSLQESENALIKVQNFYDRMPVEVKNKFNTFNKFVQAIGGEELSNMLMSAHKVDTPPSDPQPNHKVEVTPNVDTE